MKIKEKIELYFFNPWEDEDRYTDRFFNINPKEKIKAYSPLYLMRRQILLLSGQLIKFPAPPIWQTPYFSAILVANIAIDGLKDLTKLNRVSFYKDYLGLDLIRHIGLRILRNALEHNNFQLYHRVYNKEYEENKGRWGNWEFSKIEEYLKDNKKLGQRVKLKFFKINYALHDSSNKKIILPPKVDKIYNKSDKYALITFNIWPFKFLKQFEKAAEKAKQKIMVSENLKKHFDETISIDNWMKIYQ